LAVLALLAQHGQPTGPFGQPSHHAEQFEQWPPRCGAVWDFVQGALADKVLLAQLIQPGRFDAVMHLASFIQVGESVQQPAK
jgi:UDP-glucose 4-epimerase